MMVSKTRKVVALVSEVARVLRMEPDDVIRCIDEDGLPAIRIPGRTRTVRRIAIPALHRWLVERSGQEAVGTLEEFTRNFND